MRETTWLSLLENSGWSAPYHIRSSGFATTVTKLGAVGRKLMLQDIYSTPNPNFKGEFDLMRNDADSSHRNGVVSLPPLILDYGGGCGGRRESWIERRFSKIKGIFFKVDYSKITICQ